LIAHGESRVNPRRRVVDNVDVNGLLVTSDDGANWTSAEAGLPATYSDYRFAVDSQTPALYVGTYDGLFRSTIPKLFWRPTGLREATVTAVAVSASSPAVLYAGVAPTADAFVSKLSPDGTSLPYSTYVGGANQDGGLGIVVDGFGNAFVTGGSRSLDFPVTRDAFQTANHGGRDEPYAGDGFLIELAPSGELRYATYFGGSDAEAGAGIAIGLRGRIVVVGETLSTDFPNWYPSPAVGSAGPFVLKFTLPQ
jgi:hypothetical protein